MTWTRSPFASSEMGDSMDADLLPELSGETWVAATYMDELLADLPMTGSDLDLVVASVARRDLDHCTQVGTVRGGSCVVRMCGIISGAAMLVAAVRESVGGHGGEVVALRGSSSDVLSVGCACSGKVKH